MIADVISLQMSRRFDASPERVFDAWLSKAWGDWIGPRTVRGEVTLLEPRVGGRYRIIMHRRDSDPLIVEGVYRQIERPFALVFTWTWTHEERESRVSLRFHPVGSGTEMTIRHEGFSAPERRDSHRQGWTTSFDKLANALRAEETPGEVIELIGVPQSNFVRTLRIALIEKGVPYRLVPARPHSPEVEAIHPFGKIPVMRHGDFVLCESKAIASYIDRRYEGVRLFPDEARSCSLIEQWVSLINTTIQPDIQPYLRGATSSRSYRTERPIGS